MYFIGETFRELPIPVQVYKDIFVHGINYIYGETSVLR